MLYQMMKHKAPVSYPAQNNGCPIFQPCFADCGVCKHFHIGDEVVSIAGSAVGKRGEIVSLGKIGKHHYAKMNPSGYTKYINNYRKRYDQNDIESYLPSQGALGV